MCSRRAWATIALLVAAAALAVPASASAGYIPSRDTPVRWPAYSQANPLTIPYYFETRFPGRKHRNRILSAAREWNKQQRGFSFRPAGTRSDPANGRVRARCQSNGRRAGIFKFEEIDRRRGVVGLTQTCYALQSGYPKTIHSWITTLDSNESWYRKTGNGNAIDLKSLAMHEFGHALGLGHYRANDSYCGNSLAQETMCVLYYAGTERQRTLGSRDKKVLSLAYPSPVFWADAERPRQNEWASATGVDCPSQVNRSAPAARGKYFYSINLDDDDSAQYVAGSSGGDPNEGMRCELATGNPGGPGFPTYRVGDELWFAWQVRFPSNFFRDIRWGSTCHPGSSYDNPQNKGAHHAIAQWKQLGAGSPIMTMGVLSNGTSPRFCFGISNGRPATEGAQNRTPQADNDTTFIRPDNGQPADIDVGPVPASTTQWVKFSMHVRFAPEFVHPGTPFSSTAKGSIELCGDLGDGLGFRRLLFLNAPTAKWYKDESGPRQTHSRIGIYRGAALSDLGRGRETVHYDGYTVATTRAAAETNAFGAVQTAPAGQCEETGTGTYRYEP